MRGIDSYIKSRNDMFSFKLFLALGMEHVSSVRQFSARSGQRNSIWKHCKSEDTCCSELGRDP